MTVNMIGCRGMCAEMDNLWMLATKVYYGASQRSQYSMYKENGCPRWK